MDLNDKKILLGLKIKSFRKEKGYTQEKLSEVLSMDISALSKIENGKCFPSLETICKFMEVLKVCPNSLFDFILNDTKNNNIEDDIALEKVRQLSHKDKIKVLKFIELIKN
ncbi:MAG: helix-turn-helix transcriptional regulator [Candidatus Gastranaerophilales bacterium]|nr:helix-turn-helix transcriptional regulator [Candidatus Gastranaerophilales bacterium]